LIFPARFRIARRVGAALLSAAFAIGQPASGQDLPATREFIVKFKPGSEGDRIAAEAMQNPSRQSALFAELAASIGRAVALPVRIAAVTSGRELVLSVDAAAAAAAAVAGLEERPDVVRAAAAGTGDAPQAAPRDPVIAVEFAADSPTGRALAADDAAVRDMQADIARQAGAPLLPLPNAVTFTLDVGRLTAELGDRLKQRQDVDYIQPNMVVQPQ